MRIHFILGLLLFTFSVSAQAWLKYGDLPTGGRYDDIHFVNDELGFTINSSGDVYKTENGGLNWQQLIRLPVYPRAIDFIDEEVGIIGTLGHMVYRTEDGGESWQNITDSLPMDMRSLCGLAHMEETFYGTGVYASPAYFVKSTDKGRTWTSRDLSDRATGLVECHFIDEQVGFISGVGNNGAIIFKTEDGGDTWLTVFESDMASEYVWKLDFVSDDIIYGSIETFSGARTRAVKSTDGGDTWDVLTVIPVGLVDMQGVGFIDENRGWLGARVEGMWITEDGGQTWTQDNTIANINRIIPFQENKLLAVGSELFIYDDGSSATNSPASAPVAINEITEVSPNPFVDELHITIDMLFHDRAVLDLCTADGKIIKNLTNERLAKGRHVFSVGADVLTQLPRGEYLVLLRTDHGFDGKKVIR